MGVRLFFDMDGVLAVWNKDASIEDTTMKGYFVKREIERKVVKLVKKLVAAGYDVSILSSVYRDAHSARDKREWLNAVGLGEVPRIFIPYGEVKREYIRKEDGNYYFLIDDFSKNLREWEEEDGFFGIKFFNQINGTKGTWNGFSISNKMEVDRMFITVTGIVNSFKIA